MKQDLVEQPEFGIAWKAAGAFATGAVIGAAVAIAVAPSTGREARAYLKKQGREVARTVAEQGRKVWQEQVTRATTALDT